MCIYIYTYIYIYIHVSTQGLCTRYRSYKNRCYSAVEHLLVGLYNRAEVFTARYGLNLEFRLIVGCNLLTMFSSRIAVGYDIVVGHLNTPVKT